MLRRLSSALSRPLARASYRSSVAMASSLVRMPSYVMLLPLTSVLYAIIYDAKASQTVALDVPALPPDPASQDPHPGPSVPDDGRRGGSHVPPHPLGRYQRRAGLPTLRFP